MRLRLIDCRLSRLPTLIGKCQADIADIAQYVNTAQQRLLYAKEAADESWYGTWAEVRLNVSRAAPYITLPREIARLEAITICDRPVPVFNQFYEYLQFGNGKMRQGRLNNAHKIRAAYTRNNAVLFTDLTNGPQLISLYTSDPADVQSGKRVLVQGLDQNGNPVYTQDGNNQVLGEFVVLASPFATTTFQYTRITGIQKDITLGSVQIFQMDPVSGVQLLLSTMEPGEQTTDYRRYFFDCLPCGCCPTSNIPQPIQNCTPPQVTAIAKLELIPVAVDTDYLLFHNLEAVIEECMSVRFSQMDTESSQRQSALHHTNAIRLLNGELGHYLGVNDAAVRVQVFGSARLERQWIGTMI